MAQGTLLVSFSMFTISWGADFYALSYNTPQGKYFPVKHAYPTIQLNKRDGNHLVWSPFKYTDFIHFHLSSVSFDTFNLFFIRIQSTNFDPTGGVLEVFLSFYSLSILFIFI